MDYNLLGKSDLRISRIGMGTMSLEADNPLTEDLILQALDQGINYFDTADLYLKGLNETMLGNAFRTHRKQVVLATKVGNRWSSDGSSWDWVPTKKYILAAVEESLKRLQTDYIDLYQLHGGTLEDPIDDIIEAFEMLQVAGKIRYYGISSIRPNVIREYVKRSSIVSVMMQYSLLDRRPEEEMLHFLHERGVGVLARGVLAKGLLVSKPAEAYLNHSVEKVLAVAQTVKEFSNNDRSAESIAIHYVLDHSAIGSSVIGIRTLEQLKKAIDAVETEPLSKFSLQTLSQHVPVNYYELNR